MKHKKFQKGFTLVETLLFLGLSSVTALTFLFFLVNINRINASLRTTRDIEQYGALAKQEISDRIENAEYIVSPEVVDGAVNTVVVKEREADNFSEIRVDGTQLLISQNGGRLNSLFPSGIAVIDSSFERLDTNGTSQGLRYSFTIEYDQSGAQSISEEYTYSQTFSGTVSTQDVANIFPKSSIVGWFQSDEGIVLESDGQTLSFWTDVSGNGNNLYRTDESPGAILATDVLNGYPVVRFDGTDDYMEGSMRLSGSPFTVVIVSNVTAQPIGNEGAFIELWDRNGTDRVAFEVNADSDEFRLFKHGDILTNFPSVDIGNFAIYTLTHSSTNLSVYKNNESMANETSSTGLPTLTTMRIGDDSTEGDELTGDIAEVLIFDSALSGSERLQVHDYLNAKYNIYNQIK